MFAAYILDVPTQTEQQQHHETSDEKKPSRRNVCAFKEKQS